MDDVTAEKNSILICSQGFDSKSNSLLVEKLQMAKLSQSDCTTNKLTLRKREISTGEWSIIHLTEFSNEMRADGFYKKHLVPTMLYKLYSNLPTNIDRHLFLEEMTVFLIRSIDKYILLDPLEWPIRCEFCSILIKSKNEKVYHKY